MNQIDEFFQFEKLPPEIQENILNYNPELIEKYNKISRSIRNISSNLYIKELCERPISIKEILHYLDTKPNIFLVPSSGG